MAQRFDGKVVLVTGASRGIGFGVAQRLVDEGAKVCLTARKPEPLAEAVAALGGEEHALAVVGKADNPEHQAETVERVLSTFGRLDALVNNTGISLVTEPLIDLDAGAARKMFEVNVLSALSWTQHAYRSWFREHGGAVLNMSSVAGFGTSPDIGFYGATKAMLAHVTKQLARELGPGIRVNGIAPAVVKTQFATALYEGREQEVTDRYPLGRLGTPEDVGGAAAFLLSEDASWITGEVLVVDGGVLLTGGL